MNCLQHTHSKDQGSIMSNTSGTYHTQCHVSYDTKGQLCYQVWQSWKRFNFLGLFLWLKPLTDEEGEGNQSTWTTLTPSPPPQDELEEMPHTKAQKFKLQPKLEPAL